MKTTFKNLIILIIAIFLVAGFFLLFNNPKKSAKIISANFVGFDFARAITGSDAWKSLKGANQVASWAANQVAWAVDHDIIGSNGNLNPRGNATRAEATKMILLGVHV